MRYNNKDAAKECQTEVFMKKKIWITAAAVLGIFVLGFAALATYLTVTEYQPDDQERVKQSGTGTKTIKEGDSLGVLTFNIGYGALDKAHDFFMDGGKTVNVESRKVVLDNMQGIADTIYDVKADVVFLQEVDRDSKRSYYLDEADYLMEANPGYAMTYAANFRCSYVPYPIPTIGKVEGGLTTLSRYDSRESTRIALPTSFQWPVRVAQLKRCLLVERVQLEGSDQELVLVNLHLEAYDDGAGKEAQTKVLFDFLQGEYEKGNYCIAGGDFNQTFDGSGEEEYPLINDKYFQPGRIDTSALGEGWSFVNDTSVPTSRLLNEPYDPKSENTQYYVIDGFILSPNVRLEGVKTLERGFTYSDHNPVMVKVTLTQTKGGDEE